VLPHFSIVIPTYERPGQLRGCLGSMLALEYPRDRFEVLVVDDGSSTPLDPIVAPFAGELDLSLIRQPNAGPAAARNAAVECARGEFLAFTDDDCRVEPGWLRELGRVLAEAPDCMVGGITVNEARSICSATSQLIVDVVYRHYNADPQRARFIASNNFALSSRGFREVGGFDPGFRAAEDRDLCDRWRHLGRRIVLTHAAKVRHNHPMRVRGFCRQHFEYGRGAERFNRTRAGRGSGSMLVELRFHLDVTNWLGYPLSRVPLGQAPAVAGLLALWQAANLVGFLWEKVRRGRSGPHRGALSFSG
jgi:glycosyltransferase involved in cell wall biosynthesis